MVWGSYPQRATVQGEERVLCDLGPRFAALLDPQRRLRYLLHAAYGGAGGSSPSHTTHAFVWQEGDGQPDLQEQLWMCYGGHWQASPPPRGALEPVSRLPYDASEARASEERQIEHLFRYHPLGSCTV